MRIAVVCSDPRVPLPGSTRASLQLESMSRALAGLGHRVLLVGVLGHGGPPPGLDTVLLPPPERTGGLRGELGAVRFARGLGSRALEAVAGFAPEVVYERLSLFGLTGRRLARAVGAPHVLEVPALPADAADQWHDLWLADLARRRQRLVLDGGVLRIAASGDVAEQLRRVSPLPPTTVVAPGMDEQLFQVRRARGPARLVYRLPAEAPVLAVAAPLRADQGVAVALRALPLLPGVHLAVAGTGPDQAALAGLAAQLGVAERVHWLGHLPYREMPRLLATADVALAPCDDRRPGSPAPAVYEYLGAGVPVVASAVGPLRSLLDDGRWGALVPPGNPAALAGAVRDLLADPARARDRATAARDMALRDHSWRARAIRITDLLTELVQGAVLAT